MSPLQLAAALVSVLSLGAGPLAAQPPAAPSLDDEVRAVLAEHADAAPGISVAVIDARGSLHTYTHGLARTDPPEPMTPAARMFSGSIGKTYCAAVLLQLADEGVLSLDDHLADHLGDEPWLDRLPNARNITLRQLARHQSGIPEHVWMPEFAAALKAEPMAHREPAELVAFVLDADPLFPAGEGWSYADTNYILLGMVIEAAAGERYETLLQRRVLDPLGLRDTTPSSGPQLPGLVSGYTALGEVFGLPEEVASDGAYAINPQFEWTGGGIVSTTADLARFMHAFCAGDLLPEPQREVAREATPARLWPGASYAIGLIRRPCPAGEILGHTGIFPGYLSSAWHIPAAEATVAVQLNSDAPDAARALDQITLRLVDILSRETE